MNNKIMVLALGLMLSPLALAAPDAAANQAGDGANIEQQLRDLQAQINELQDLQNEASEVPRWVSRLHVHGFGSFGLQLTNAHDGAFYRPTANANNQVYPGVGDQWDQRGISRAGLQVAADLDDNTQLVTQMVARGSDNYEVHLQWAYISHKLTPDLMVRAGRLVLPFYMHSQYYDVGYAYPWVVLPDEVYDTVPGDTADGIDLAWNVATGPIVHTLGLQWANTDIHAPSGSYHVQNMLSANLSSTWRSLTVRLGYSGGKVDHTGAAPLLDIDKAYAYFANVGFKYDDGRFLLAGEWTQLDVKGYFPLTRSSYTTAGVHIGRWLPMLTYGMVDTSNHEESVLPVLGLVAQQQQRRIAYGVRYDVTSNVSLKAELNQIYGLGATPGLFGSAPEESSTNLLRLSVDAMF